MSQTSSLACENVRAGLDFHAIKNKIVNMIVWLFSVIKHFSVVVLKAWSVKRSQEGCEALVCKYIIIIKVITFIIALLNDSLFHSFIKLKWE